MRVRGALFRACLIAGLVGTLAPVRARGQAGGSAQTAQPAPPDGVTRLVLAIEAAIRAGNGPALRALARPGVNAGRLSEFAVAMTQTPVTELTIKERDRQALRGGGERVLLEILTVSAGEGHVWTWRIDAVPPPDAGPWRIGDLERLTQINGLYRLALDPAVEWDVHDAVITAPDLTLTMASGYAFAARVPDGATAMVFIGRGSVQFAPAPAAERGQVRIFAGSDALHTGFGALFIRLAPAELQSRLSAAALKARPVDAGHLRRARQLFDAQLPNSFTVDLNDLSTARWSLVPSGGDFVAEIVTGKYGPLTYARSSSDAEDISFFDRRRRRNIAVYASAEKLAARGRFYSEDEKVGYHVTHYRIEASYSPERLWIEGTATLTVRARDFLAGTMMLSLADSLVVRSISSPQFGRLLHLRVVGQNNVLVGLPTMVPPEAEFELVIAYGGRLPPQSVDREAVFVGQEPQAREQDIVIPPEPQWLYSNRSYWYPQETVTDYATATIALTVPGEYDVVASGTRQGPPSLVEDAPGQQARKRFVFESAEPARYLAFAVSRYQTTGSVSLKLRDDEEPITLVTVSNPRQTGRARQLGEKAAEIVKFYASLLGDAPYDSLTLAVTESELPGGHSPPYLALLLQPLPSTPYVWSNDPVAFPGYPSFFLAHEIAHQWWGQAIGWKNYHEQWLSEGFAQYFAATYAEKERGADTFTGVIRQMRRWAIDMSPQGPVYLGYRLGHIRGDPRVFRSLVYNKGAMVVHMLRRLVGDEAFFTGLREFYQTWRYHKAGTDDLRQVMEKASGRPLSRFFERWIYGSGIPTATFTHHVDANLLRVRFEQKGEVYDVPITVTVGYADGSSEDFVVAMTDRIAERTITLKKAVRSVEANKDGGALIDIAR